MPTYEFICKKCENRFEVMVPSAEKSSVRCPACNSGELQEKFGVNVGSAKGRAGESACSQSESCPSRRFGFG